MPDHWQSTTLGEITVLEYGKALKEADRDGSGFPVFGSAGEVGRHSVPLVTEGPVIVVGRKGTAGSVHWSPEPCSVIDTAYWVRIKAEHLEPEFAYLAISSLNLPSLSAQTGVPGLNRERAYSKPVDVPPPAEQRRIVDLVGSIDAYIDALETQIEATRTARVGVLSELLSNPGEDWRSTTLGQIAKLVSGQAFPRKEQGGLMGLPFIKVSDMNRPGNEIGITDAENFVTDEQVERMRLRISPAGTVVFPKVGAALMTEKRRMLTVPTVFDNNIMGLVASHEVLPEFLFFWMQTVRLGQWAQEGAVPSVNNGIVGNLEIALPPLAEQQRIVDLVGSVDEQTTALNSQVAAFRELRSGVLSELLSGEHRLPESYDKFVEAS